MFTFNSKKVCLLFLVLVCVILNSCSINSPLCATDILYNLMKETSAPDCNIYFKNSIGYSNNILEQNDICSLYSENGELPREFWDCYSYAVALSPKDCFYEIHIVLTNTVSERRIIEKMFKNRIKMLKSEDNYLFSPEKYETRVICAKIFGKKNICVLLLTDYNDKAISFLKDII